MRVGLCDGKYTVIHTEKQSSPEPSLQEQLDAANAYIEEMTKKRDEFLQKLNEALDSRDRANARVAQLEVEMEILRAVLDGETAAFDWMMRQNAQLQTEIQQLRGEAGTAEAATTETRARKENR